MKSTQEPQKYLYLCMICNAVHTSEEWNEHTYNNHCRPFVNDPQELEWSTDELFHKIEEAFDSDHSPWYHCPSCDDCVEPRDGIERVPAKIANKSFKQLLDESW